MPAAGRPLTATGTSMGSLAPAHPAPLVGWPPLPLVLEIVIRRLQKFHSATKSRQISTIARRNFVEKTRRDSPWQPATVAQVRVSIPSRNPEILTPIGAPPAIVFDEFLSQMAMPRGAVRRDKDGDLRQIFKASPFLMLSPTSLIFARPAKQWGVSFAPLRRFW